MTDTRRPISTLAHDLLAHGHDAPNYRALADAARSGHFPAERGANGRWTYDPADVPLIAKALHLTVQRPAIAHSTRAAG